MKKMMKRLTALLSCLVLFCAIVPFHAMAADGNLIADGSFDSGINNWIASKGTKAEARDGAMFLDFNEDWGFARTDVRFKKNTNYVLTFDAKSNFASGVNVKLNKVDWTGTVQESRFDLSTQWQTFTWEFNSGAYGDMMFFFQSNHRGSDNQEMWVDNVVLKESDGSAVVTPNKVVNPDFETGTEQGWILYQSTEISADAAYEGSYGAHLKGNGGWGAMLEQEVALTIGKTYHVEFWYKINSNGFNWKMCKGNSAEYYGTNWVTDSSWTKVTCEFEATTDTLMINFTGAGNGKAEDAYVDNFVFYEVESISATALENGDFENGDASWNLHQSTTISADAAHDGTQGAHLKGNGSWGALLEQEVALVVGKQYHFEFWYKINSNGFNWKIVKGDGSGNYDTNWVMNSEWTKVSVDFEATTSTAFINISGAGNGKVEDAYVDGFILREKDAAVPGELINGSFENGDNGWKLTGSCQIVEGDAYDGTYAVRLEHNSPWAEALSQTLPVEPNTDYVISFYTKRVSGGGAWNLALWDGDKTKQLTFTEGENWFNHSSTGTWKQVKVEFNTGNVDNLFIKIQPETATSGVFLLDYMTLNLKGEEPEVPVIPPAARPYMTSYGVAINRPASKADNMLVGADFEDGTFGYDHATITSVVDATAPQGEKSLYFCTSTEKNLVKQIIWIDVAPNTDYVFSTWLKGAYISPENPEYNATIGVVNEQGTYLSMSKWIFLNGERQIVPTAWDNAWHLRAIQFYSAEATRIGICLSGYGSQLWLDDMALFRVDRGVKYASSNLTGMVDLSFATPIATCQPEANLLPDSTFNTKDVDGFWSGAQGWRNGALSFVDSDYEYGTSLLYKSTGRVASMSTIKWIDVEPGTDYTFSLNMKILESGDGRLLLLDDKKRVKSEFLYIGFDADIYDEEAAKDGWYQLSCSFNTDVYTRIGICIVDGGGEVLLDNMRMFKVADADESVTDAFITPPAQPDEPDEPDHPNTGDNRTAMWAAILALLVAAVAVPLLSGKKEA